MLSVQWLEKKYWQPKEFYSTLKQEEHDESTTPDDASASDDVMAVKRVEARTRKRFHVSLFVNGVLVLVVLGLIVGR